MKPILKLMRLLFCTKWCNVTKRNHYNFSNTQILDLIGHFFSNEIDKDRYLSGISSKLWDKHADIQTSLDNMREYLHQEYSSKQVNNRPVSPGNATNASIYDMYNYCTDITVHKTLKKMIVYKFHLLAKCISKNIFSITIAILLSTINLFHMLGIWIRKIIMTMYVIMI